MVMEYKPSTMCVLNASDIPVLPTITAQVTFREFEFRKDLPDSLFAIPPDYSEDSNRSVAVSNDRKAPVLEVSSDIGS